MGVDEVPGLLVLLGVVGVLTAIVGSGIEAGPVKFPSIPGSRQKPLAIASVGVLAGGVILWILQKPPEKSPNASATSGSAPSARAGGAALKVSLVPHPSNEIPLGGRLTVGSEVDTPTGGQLGEGQCILTWRDQVHGKNVRPLTPMACNSTFVESPIRQPGTHRITATANGIAGTRGRGSKAISVVVTSP